MAVKLEGLSPKELESLIKQAQAKMAAAKIATIATVRAKMGSGRDTCRNRTLWLKNYFSPTS